MSSLPVTVGICGFAVHLAAILSYDLRDAAVGMRVEICALDFRGSFHPNMSCEA